MSEEDPASADQKRGQVFREVFERLPHPVVVIGAGGEAEHMNPAFEKQLGYSRDEVRNADDWFRLAYPDPEVRQELYDSWQADTANPGDALLGPRTLRATCKDGTERDLEMLVQPLEDGRLVVIMVDATERVRAVEALSEEQERYRVVSDLVSDYAYCFNVEEGGDLETEWVVGALPKVTGFTREELRDRGGWEALLLPEDLPIALRQLEQLLAGEAAVVDYRIVAKSGDVRWMRDHARPVRQGNRTVQILGAVQDVTDLRRAEEERARLQTQMLHLQKLESLGVLAGGIAHDFNNILVAVASYADLASKRASADPTLLRYLDQVKAATRRLTELTDQMLAYSGRANFEVETLDVSRLVSDIGELLTVTVSKNARLRYECNDGLPPVEGDAAQLRQVVMNLILNASDAVRKTGGTITVRTESRLVDRARLAQTFVDDALPEGRYVVLEIVDDGPGMPEDVRQRVFEPFFTTKFSGRGLGLATVLGIVRGHGGAIDVDSSPGHGATFRVFLPVSANAEELQEPREQQRRTTPNAWHVLVVDDEESVRRVVSDILTAEGHEVTSTASGAEAIEAVRRSDGGIDIALLDLTMPDMGGHECLAALHELRPELPVILTSGYSEVDARSRVEGQSLAGFIKKPFDAATLLEYLGRALT